jgi:hypothetical protein
MIVYLIQAVFFLLVLWACFSLLMIPDQASHDAYQNLHYPDHPKSHSVLTAIYSAILLFIVSYGGFYLLSKSNLGLMPFHSFTSYALSIQVIMGVLGFYTLLNDHSNQTGTILLMIFILIVPGAAIYIYKLAQ